jgi:hypothetical protein
MLRIRHDKALHEADTLALLGSMLGGARSPRAAMSSPP